MNLPDTQPSRSSGSGLENVNATGADDVMITGSYESESILIDDHSQPEPNVSRESDSPVIAGVSRNFNVAAGMTALRSAQMQADMELARSLQLEDQAQMDRQALADDRHVLDAMRARGGGGGMGFGRDGRIGRDRDPNDWQHPRMGEIRRIQQQLQDRMGGLFDAAMMDDEHEEHSESDDDEYGGGIGGGIFGGASSSGDDESDERPAMDRAAARRRREEQAEERRDRNRLVRRMQNPDDFTEDDYELLQRLDSGNRANRGLSAAELSQLPTHTIGPGEAEEDCLICLEKMKPGQVVLRLPCLHVFHNTCITKWFRNAKTCPVDQLKIPDLLNQNMGHGNPNVNHLD